MSFLLDTNVISEWVKPQPNPHVVAWLKEVEEDRVFLSVASLAEIRRGIELMPPGKRRDRLFSWLTGNLPARFAGRLLDIDGQTAEHRAPPGGFSWHQEAYDLPLIVCGPPSISRSPFLKRRVVSWASSPKPIRLCSRYRS